MNISQCSNRYQVRKLVDADLKQVLVKDHSRAPFSVSNSLQKDASRLCRKQSSVQSFLVQSWILSNWRGQRNSWKNNRHSRICIR